MRFLFSVTVFAVIFSLIECKLRAASLEQTDYYNLRSESCKNMSVTKKQTKCMPRPILVNLTFDPNYVFDPPMVHVNRCVGDCDSHICSQTESENVTRVIQRYRRNSNWINNIECAALEIEEHKRCSCMCETQPDDCHRNQTYDVDNCKCICPNQRENKINCEIKMGMQWMKDTCDCKCMMMTKECTSGHMWNNTICECEPNLRL